MWVSVAVLDGMILFLPLQYKGGDLDYFIYSQTPSTQCGDILNFCVPSKFLLKFNPHEGIFFRRQLG